MALSSDILARKHARDFDTLRRKGWRSPIGLAIIFACVACIIGFAIYYLGGHDDSWESGRKELLQSKSAWSRELIERQDGYRSWIERHGTTSELAFYESISSLVFQGAMTIGGKDKRAAGEPSFLTKFYIWLAFAALQISFLLVASWRLWLFAGIAAAIWGFFSLRVHKGRDLLGETGTGKIFYSGIYAGLSNVTPEGWLKTQVTGLACPPTVEAKVVQGSELGNLLAKYGASNLTTTRLAGILLAHAEIPAYLTQREDEKLLEKFFVGAKLPDNAAVLLETALSLHASYRSGDPNEVTVGGESLDSDGERIDSRTHGVLLGRAMHRVLTPDMRACLAEVPAAQVAAAVLAAEAGKVLGYAFEGSRWWKKTQYPQLSARAVLHSISSFADEYDVTARNTIRRALIYAARSGAFGPVRFAVDLSDQSEALRQWLELLFTCPHELQGAADEVELFGRIRLAHKRWSQRLMDNVVTMVPDCVENVHATPFNSFFMPVTSILSQLRSVIEREDILRIEELVTLVSQRQRLDVMALENGGSEQERTSLPVYERLLPPLSVEEQKKLAELYKLSLNDVRDWSYLRTVLFLNGWLAKRIGDFSVPDSSIVFAVFEVPENSRGANEHNLIGQSAVVPLRATRLADKWGKNWQSRFVPVLSATIAENKEDYDKLMRGERLAEERTLDDVSSALA